MRPFIAFTLLLLGTANLNFAQIREPRAGVARYADGSVRVVYGISGNYIVRGKSSLIAQHAAFAEAGGLLATRNALQLMDPDMNVLGEVTIADSTPLLNIDSDVTTAIAWLPNQRSLTYWNGKTFSQTEVRDEISGTASWVTRLDANRAELLTFDGSGNTFANTISLDSGNVVSVRSLPGVVGPAYQLRSALVAHTTDGLRIYLIDGTAVNIPLSVNDLIVEHMSSNSLHLSSASGQRDWVLHLDAKGVQLWELPAHALAGTHVEDASSGEVRD